MTEPEDELTGEERRALDAWRVPEAPDVSARVLAQLDDAPRRPFWIGVAVVSLLATAVIGSVAIRSDPAEASYVAERRMTAPIGGRAVAVMEEGAELSYRGRGGIIEVEQPAGNVFYRVDPGGPFEVQTPAGTVVVLGTCFRVEVREMNSKTAGAFGGAIGSAAGALVASTVLVTVYEGKVVTASPAGGELTLEAGEGAELVAGRAPVGRKVRITSGPESLELTTLDPAKLPEQVLLLSRDKAALEREVAQLRQELSKAKGQPGETRMYDIDQTELVQMAERCELRWDMPNLGPKPPNISTENLEKLELSEDEREVIDRKLAEAHARLTEEVRRAYTAVTGDENTGSLATEAMLAEIKDKTPVPELKRIFQVLARERAGLSPRVPEGASIPPVEQLYRTLTSAGDRLERSIATELGPETARRLRDLNKGWGDRFRSTRGCP